MRIAPIALLMLIGVNANAQTLKSGYVFCEARSDVERIVEASVAGNGEAIIKRLVGAQLCLPSGVFAGESVRVLSGGIRYVQFSIRGQTMWTVAEAIAR